MKPSYVVSLIALSVSFASAQDVTAESSARLPPVDSKQLQRQINRKNLLRHAEQFQKFADSSNGNRAFGSKGHNATISYIKGLLDKTGYYDTYLQTFPYTYAESNAYLSVDGKPLSTKGIWFAPGGNVTAPLSALEEFGCTPEHFPPSVAGKIVLIQRGECIYGIKVALAGAAGAVGVVIYNDLDSELFGGSLGGVSRPEGPFVPTGSISGINGRALRATVDAGQEIIGDLDTNGLVEERYSSNLIATSKQGDKSNIVFSGSHSDSVPAGPGINDDGSGTIGNLEVALQLSKYRVKNAVRFGWWTAEEFGLVGSSYHVRNLSPAERDKIALYLNFDMIASPNAGFLIYDGDGDTFQRPGPPGSAQIEKLYENFYAERGLKSAPSNFSGRSDYGPFLEYGIPAGGIFTGADGIKTAQGAEWWGGQAGVIYDPCYHSRCDTVANLKVDTFEVNVQAIAHSIATYAGSLQGFPREPRGLSTQSEPLYVDTLTWEERRYYACEHQHDVSWE